MDSKSSGTSKKEDLSTQVLRPVVPQLETLGPSDLKFDRLQPSDQELVHHDRFQFGKFVAREAVLDEEYWVGQWLIYNAWGLFFLFRIGKPFMAVFFFFLVDCSMATSWKSLGRSDKWTVRITFYSPWLFGVHFRSSWLQLVCDNIQLGLLIMLGLSSFWYCKDYLPQVGITVVLNFFFLGVKLMRFWRWYLVKILPRLSVSPTTLHASHLDELNQYVYLYEWKSCIWLTLASPV